MYLMRNNKNITVIKEDYNTIYYQSAYPSIRITYST